MRVAFPGGNDADAADNDLGSATSLAVVGGGHTAVSSLTFTMTARSVRSSDECVVHPLLYVSVGCLVCVLVEGFASEVTNLKVGRSNETSTV